MKRHVAVLVALVGGAATAWLLSRPPSVPSDPVYWPVSELPKSLRDGLPSGPVRVSFLLPLTSTADPLVWHYHPGRPVEVAPATYSIRFVREPKFPARLPVTVEGFAAFAPDGVRRVNGVPGVVVLSDAVLRESP